MPHKNTNDIRSQGKRKKDHDTAKAKWKKTATASKHAKNAKKIAKKKRDKNSQMIAGSVPAGKKKPKKKRKKKSPVEVLRLAAGVKKNQRRQLDAAKKKKYIRN
jgi:hypothetical protein